MSAITLFEEKQVRRAWNATEEKWYLAIVDVIAILTDSPNPQVYWRVMKKRLKDEGNETVTNCNGLELIFTMLGEASTTEIAKKRGAQGFPQNKQAAKDGGAVAGNARRDLESQSGTRIPSKANFKDIPEAKAPTKRIPPR